MITFIDDLEGAIVAQLSSVFPEVRFSTVEPAPRPKQWVRVFLGGDSGGPVRVHEKVILTVESWHETSTVKANELAQQIRREVSRWAWERGFELADPTTGASARVVEAVTPRPISYPPGERWARYSATYQLTLSRSQKRL